jgi:hypothetical protein
MSPMAQRLGNPRWLNVTFYGINMDTETRPRKVNINKQLKKAKAVPLHAMKAFGEERRYSSYSYSTSALDVGEWSASRPGRALAPGKRHSTIITMHVLYKKKSHNTPMEAQVGGDVLLLLIHDVGTRWECMVSVTPGPRFTPGERTTGHCTGGWVGPRAGLATQVKGKISCLCRVSNLDHPVVQSIARHYTDWAFLAPMPILYWCIFVNKLCNHLNVKR